MLLVCELQGRSTIPAYHLWNLRRDAELSGDKADRTRASLRSDAPMRWSSGVYPTPLRRGLDRLLYGLLFVSLVQPRHEIGPARGHPSLEKNHV
jgi:hypothetical protein